ncbi:hypothetical protein D9Q98_009759 [Chlorella vulgaris]|uniref:Plasma membrane ATPase n=1 Tax=Chlorella vulgaris TaxID=3077 RepID=A0A9D4TEZ9_CHLVU|nr:hypothetical protein D9Q98_009759 [Chlorella vulgaris]
MAFSSADVETAKPSASDGVAVVSTNQAAPKSGAHDVEGLSSSQVEELRKTHGYNEVKSTQTPEWKKIAWRYLHWVSLVIIAAAVVSASVKSDGKRGWTSFTLLVIELNLVVWVGYLTDRNAGNAIKELEELAAPQALVLRDGSWVQLTVRELVPGDVVELKGGDIIPADCKLVGEGEPLKIDESSLTGESMAVSRRPGDKVLAGAVVSSGELHARVTETGTNTFFGKTMALLAAPEESGHLQTVLGRVNVALGVLGAAGCLAILGDIIGRTGDIGLAFVTAFVILVSVVPIGMPVVVGAVLAAGAREMAQEKAIVSRLSALEELSGMEVLCSDKTGTLTLNRLTLDKADIQAWAGFTADDVLLLGSLSAKWTNADAIDGAVTAAVGPDESCISAWKIRRFVPFNPVDKKTLAEVTAPDGRALITCKGAPQIIGDLLTDGEAKAAVTTYIAERASRGLRSLGVAQSTDGGASWTLVGLISLLDPPREDSAATIKLANSLGVEVKMVTGDQHAIAVETSRRLGLGTDIMEGAELMGGNATSESLIAKVREVDGFAGVYPEHKFAIVEALQANGALIGMTGDGVNDAPALKRANVGIAVAGATAAAKGAADIILTEEGIGTIITAIIRSRKIFRRLETYIIYRMTSSLVILGFFFFAIIILHLDFPSWALVLISLLNDLAVMATSYDKVHSSDTPETFLMLKYLAVAVAIALIGVGATVLLLLAADPSYLNWWHWWNTSLDPETDPDVLTNGQTVAVMYFGITCFIQLTILLTRNPSFWWRFSEKSAPRPSLILLTPVVAFVLGPMFVAVYWPRDVQPDGGAAVLEGAGWVPVLVTFFYVVVWLQVADVGKVLVQRLFHRYDVVKEKCHQKGVRPPSWVRWIDAPSDWAERVSEKTEGLVSDCFAGMCQPLVDAVDRRRHPAPKKEVVQRVMSVRLSNRDSAGRLPQDEGYDNNLQAVTVHPATVERVKV